MDVIFWPGMTLTLMMGNLLLKSKQTCHLVWLSVILYSMNKKHATHTHIHTHTNMRTHTFTVVLELNERQIRQTNQVSSEKAFSLKDTPGANKHCRGVCVCIYGVCCVCAWTHFITKNSVSSSGEPRLTVSDILFFCTLKMSKLGNLSIDCISMFHRVCLHLLHRWSFAEFGRIFFLNVS